MKTFKEWLKESFGHEDSGGFFNIVWMQKCWDACASQYCAKLIENERLYNDTLIKLEARLKEMEKVVLKTITLEWNSLENGNDDYSKLVATCERFGVTSQWYFNGYAEHHAVINEELRKLREQEK